MSDIPGDLKFHASHEWVRVEDANLVRVGISEYAQEQLGDLVYVELPEVGDEVAADEDIAVVESVKSASDINAPVSGEIVEVNEALEDEPELVNSSPYDDGWLFVVRIDDKSELDALMTPEAYAEMLENE